MSGNCVRNFVAFQNMLQRGNAYPEFLARSQQRQNLVLTITVTVNPAFPFEDFQNGFQFEVAQFLGVGPQHPAFPTSGPTFGPNDLLTISIGGNDSRAYQLGGGTLLGAPAAATASAAFATAGMDALVAAGARNISFLSGNTAQLPEVIGNAGAQSIRSAFSNTFNSAMQTTLAGYAADGVIVHYLDGSLLLNNVVANPATGVKARYYDVTLKGLGETVLGASVTIDRLTLDKAHMLNVKPGANLKVWGDYTQYSGWTQVNGTIASGDQSIVRSPEVGGTTWVRHSTMTGSIGAQSPGNNARGFAH